MQSKHRLAPAVAGLLAAGLAHAQSASDPARPTRSQEFAGFLETQNAFWAQVVKDLGAVAE